MGGRGGRIRAWLVDLYPSAWQARYRDEYLALLDELRLTPRVLADHVRAAVAAHLDPAWEAPETRALAGRLRGGEIAVLMAWLGLVVGGLAFQRVIDDAALVQAANAHVAVRLAVDTVAVGAVVSLLAVLTGALPVLFAIGRSAIAERRLTMLALLAAPPLLLAGWLLLTLVLVVAGPGQLTPGARLPLFAAWAGTLVVALAAGGAAVSIAALQTSVPPARYRVAVKPTYLVLAAMAASVAAVLVWGAALAVQAPGLFWGDHGLVATSTAGSWAGVVLLMAASTAVAGNSTARMRRALSGRG